MSKLILKDIRFELSETRPNRSQVHSSGMG